MSARVAAIVVTYNRMQLLCECLRALIKQTQKVNEIFVVDNASTDGTSRLFEADGEMAISRVTYIRLEQNCGGAGGFYEGVKKAFEAGYEWFWMMDDDGIPASDCLQQLLGISAHTNALFRAPLVVNNKDHEALSFGYKINGVIYFKRDELIRKVRGRWFSGAQPFNGILVNRAVISKAGFPKKEMFIWGDEVEFLERCRFHGFAPITVADAIFFHPKCRQNWSPVFWGLFGADLRVNQLRLYCYYRNHAYTVLRYKGRIKLIFWALKHVIRKVICGRFTESTVVCEAIADGSRGRWGRERRFLSAP